MSEKQTIVGKIDVTKVDKNKLFKGAKGTYLDFVLIPSKDSQYGDDYMVTQSVSKEDRAKGVKGAILGNAKILSGRQTQGAAAPQTKSQPTAPSPADDDVPW